MRKMQSSAQRQISPEYIAISSHLTQKEVCGSPMQQFEVAIWPEEAPPLAHANCAACELARHRSRVIWGEGNPHAPVMVILDNPGAREDHAGQSFVCGTRETLQHAIWEVGLSADDIYVTYILKCRPIRAYTKDLARTTCLNHLRTQLVEKKPQLIMCLGNVAVQSFFQNSTLEVKNLRGSWHDNRGIPTIVSYHPLAVRRRPNLYGIFLADWQMLKAKFGTLSKVLS